MEPIQPIQRAVIMGLASLLHSGHRITSRNEQEVRRVADLFARHDYGVGLDGLTVEQADAMIEWMRK